MRHEHGMLPCCCCCRVDVCMMGFVCLGRKDMTAFHCRVVHKHNQFVIMLTCSGDNSELFVGRGLMGQGRLGRCWRRRCDGVVVLCLLERLSDEEMIKRTGVVCYLHCDCSCLQASSNERNSI